MALPERSLIYYENSEAAGKTLKAIVDVKQVYLKVKHFSVTVNAYREDTYMLELNEPDDLPTTIPFGTTTSTTWQRVRMCEVSSKRRLAKI